VSAANSVPLVVVVTNACFMMLGCVFIPEFRVHWLSAVLNGMCPLWLLGTTAFMCGIDDSLSHGKMIS
jgi:hypothetical protein